ncbi:hypothetical protein CspeluHIS016_0600980 [Cutaneotrichosporon spelunceum]|uniref:Uncharacterized protein n=1 Tax=Cutaneotrichosporon spelunceum TaxID=1672016 RepID=A0AAD3YD22_9TREE|nr:hypothetical protein CspeluHIS016_0600980 [Cutaneotrichosporon spelunceum]
MVDKLIELELVRTAMVPVNTRSGQVEYETLEYWAQLQPGVAYPIAPPPPPYLSRGMHPSAHAFVETEPFLSLGHDMVRRAMMWAGAPSHVWIRLMDGGDGNVSADALFLVGDRLRTPFDIHPSVERQRALLADLATLWCGFASQGLVGLHHPGDIVIQATREAPVTLAGFDWNPHTCDTPGRRRLWLQHFISQGFEGLSYAWPRPRDSTAGPSGSQSLTSPNGAMARTTGPNARIAGPTGRPAISPTSGASSSGSSRRSRTLDTGNTQRLSLPALSFSGPSGELSPRNQRWVEDIEFILALLLSDILSWPPTRGRVHRLYIWLIHLRDRGPIACVDLKDASKAMIGGSMLPTHPDPGVLQTTVGQYWAEIRGIGDPGVDYPAAMRLVGNPRGRDSCPHLVVDGVWQESRLEPQVRAVIEQRYAECGSPTSSTPSRSSYERLRPLARPRPLSAKCDRDAEFMAGFRPVARRMIAIAQAWPHGRRIRVIRVILAADRALGLAGYTIITGEQDEALDKLRSAADDSQYVLQESVLQLMAEFCRTSPDVPRAIVVQMHPAVHGIDVRMMWEEGEEALSGMGVTLHYLWQMFDQWGDHAASLPWPEPR